MITLSVFCRSCGRRIEEELDEQFPPASLRCSCGARYRLTIDDDTDSGLFSEVSDIDADSAADEEVLDDLESIEASVQESEAAG